MVRGDWRAAVVDNRDGPLPGVLMALTALAGLVDAVSILALDHVFVATVTGNLVFLGLGLSGAPGFGVLAPLRAVAAFLVGVVAGAAACRRAGHRGRAARDVMLLKALVAVPVTVLALAVGEPFPAPVTIAITVALAASMGAQMALIRYLKVPDLLTAVFTFALVGMITERPPPAALFRRALRVVAFAVGVLVGALVVRLASAAAALAVGLAMIAAAGLALHRVSRARSAWADPV